MKAKKSLEQTLFKIYKMHNMVITFIKNEMELYIKWAIMETEIFFSL